MKKCLIVYYSYHHGNTEKIAFAMAEAAHAELCTIDSIKSKNLSDYEIIGFGAGIAYSKHYDQLLKGVEGLSLHGKSVFVFSTSGTGGTKYHTELIKLLKNAGAEIIGHFACKGFDTFGPFGLIGGIAKGHPDGADIEAAKEFVLKMVK